jgi:cell division protein FtsW (lipid II flippase)
MISSLIFAVVWLVFAVVLFIIGEDTSTAIICSQIFCAACFVAKAA